MSLGASFESVPAHIPPERVYDYDISHDPLLKPDPHQGLMELRRRAPEIFFTPRYGGHWVAQSHDAVLEITNNTDLFSSSLTRRQLIPIGVDPPEHADYRKVLLHAFSPRTVTAMTASIEQLTAELVDKVAPRGRCEFVGEISEPLPVIVFMRMLGLPMEMLAPLRKLIIAAVEEGDLAKRDILYDEQMAMLDPVIHERTARPADDILSRIITADIRGRRPSYDEVQRFVLFLSLAGLDSVVNAMSFAVWHLARDPGLQSRLRADPAQIPAAMEELFRRYAVGTSGRRVTRDVTFRDVPLQAGDRFILLIPAANLDDARYASPEQVILGRQEPTLSFGAGIHSCPGAHLARLQIRSLLTEWLRRIPEFWIDEAFTPRAHAGVVYTVDELRLAWDGAAARACARAALKRGASAVRA
jgi:cytochrome P450